MIIHWIVLRISRTISDNSRRQLFKKLRDLIQQTTMGKAAKDIRSRSELNTFIFSSDDCCIKCAQKNNTLCQLDLHSIVCLFGFCVLLLYSDVYTQYLENLTIILFDQNDDQSFKVNRVDKPNNMNTNHIAMNIKKKNQYKNIELLQTNAQFKMFFSFLSFY